MAIAKTFNRFLETETIFQIEVLCSLDWSSVVKKTINREATGLNSAIQTHIKAYVTDIGVRWKEIELPNFFVTYTQ